MLVIFLFILSLLSAGVGVFFWLSYRSSFSKKLFSISLIVALCFGFNICLGKAISSHTMNSLINQYQELTVYYNTVNTSTNEYLRYNYYDKVQAYNKDYEATLKKSLNVFYGAFYPTKTIKQLSPIDFQLNGDTP